MLGLAQRNRVVGLEHQRLLPLGERAIEILARQPAPCLGAVLSDERLAQRLGLGRGAGLAVAGGDQILGARLHQVAVLFGCGSLAHRHFTGTRRDHRWRRGQGRRRRHRDLHRRWRGSRWFGRHGKRAGDRHGGLARHPDDLPARHQPGHLDIVVAGKGVEEVLVLHEPLGHERQRLAAAHRVVERLASMDRDGIGLDLACQALGKCTLCIQGQSAMQLSLGRFFIAGLEHFGRREGRLLGLALCRRGGRCGRQHDRRRWFGLGSRSGCARRNGRGRGRWRWRLLGSGFAPGQNSCEDDHEQRTPAPQHISGSLHASSIQLFVSFHG